MLFLLASLSGILLGARTPAIENGNFETGDLSGWTLYTTPNGTLGESSFPRIVDFDVDGNGVATKSLRLKVGQQQFKPDLKQLAGGGILTHVSLKTGNVQFSADVASAYVSPTDQRNLAGGVFEFLFDGQALAQYDVGPINHDETKRATLTGELMVLEGIHEIRIQIRRPFLSVPNDHAPLQYVDNIHIHYLRH